VKVESYREEVKKPPLVVSIELTEGEARELSRVLYSKIGYFYARLYHELTQALLLP
jgi:hypothetical protein